MSCSYPGILSAPKVTLSVSLSNLNGPTEPLKVLAFQPGGDVGMIRIGEGVLVASPSEESPIVDEPVIVCNEKIWQRLLALSTQEEREAYMEELAASPDALQSLAACKQEDINKRILELNNS